MAPSGGFSPVAISGGHGVGGFISLRMRIAVAVEYRNTLSFASEEEIWRRGVTLSRIMKPRPCVPAMRSSSLMARSRIEAAGMFNVSLIHISEPTRQAENSY